MNQEQLDNFYHNLRELCITNDTQQKEAVAGITSHLTHPQGDYTGLLRFLNYYGEKYTLSSVLDLLSSNLAGFTRIVELGAGFGWLGRGISNAYDQLPTVFVDKRQWVFTDIVADIESANGVKRVLDVLKDGDLIVMSEFLHCLNTPEKVMRPFTKWPMLVVEYMPPLPHYLKSYKAQIEKFGCRSVSMVKDVFPNAQPSNVFTLLTGHHTVWLILPNTKK